MKKKIPRTQIKNNKIHFYRLKVYKGRVDLRETELPNQLGNDIGMWKKCKLDGVIHIVSTGQDLEIPFEEMENCVRENHPSRVYQKVDKSPYVDTLWRYSVPKIN